MKQYRITAQDFVTPGESGDPDAVMNEQDLAELKRLAGINSLLEGSTTPDGGGSQDFQSIPNDSNQQITSPVGSNISITGMEKRKLEKQHHIQPGSPEWFRLWFSRPYLTGEKPIGDAPAPKIPKHIEPGADNS
jgi:hypothetical protein